jgi:predicted alpha/beta-hydrolase family hydrolase
VVAGRSAGARVACRTAQELGAVGVIALAFPLHPPGRPEKSRAEELLGSGIRTLVLQGERDAFGGPEEIRDAVSGDRRTLVEVVAVPYADHSFRVTAKAPATAAETLTTLVSGVASWLPG